ncbi:hypothetical protein JW960_16695 [candidate division KSB1 bacterium]|nr:hypothetical protein [candidate division KSB1 bacterium]
MKNMIVGLSICLLISSSDLYSATNNACYVNDQKGNKFYLTDVSISVEAGGKVNNNGFLVSANADSTFSVKFENIVSIKFIGKADIPLKNYILACVVFTDGETNEFYFSIGQTKHRHILSGMSKNIESIIRLEINEIKSIEFMHAGATQNKK